MTEPGWFMRQMVRRPWLNLVMCLLFLIVCALFAVFGGHTRGGMPMRAVGILGVVAFGYAGIQVVKKIRRRRERPDASSPI